MSANQEARVQDLLLAHQLREVMLCWYQINGDVKNV